MVYTKASHGGTPQLAWVRQCRIEQGDVCMGGGSEEDVKELDLVYD